MRTSVRAVESTESNRKKKPVEDLIGTVAEKAGIPEMKAKLAVLAVIERVDGVLPGPIAGQVKKALGVDSEGMMDGALGGLGDMLGGGDDDDDDGDGGGGLGGLGGIADAAKGLLD